MLGAPTRRPAPLALRHTRVIVVGAAWLAVAKVEVVCDHAREPALRVMIMNAMKKPPRRDKRG